jgi:hypothetical protein
MTTMTDTFQDVRDRLEAMLQNAVGGSIAASYPSFIDLYTRHFNWAFRLARVAPGPPSGVDFFSDTIEIAATMRVGHVGEGYPGSLEDLTQWQIVPDVLTYMRQRRNMVYQAGQRPPDYMNGDLKISNQGLRTAPEADQQQRTLWVTTFIISIPILVNLELCNA